MSDIDLSVTVIFMMWGQRCETRCADETEALRWLSICSGKGWLWAECIVNRDGVVLREGDDLRGMVDQ